MFYYVRKSGLEMELYGKYFRKICFQKVRYMIHFLDYIARDVLVGIAAYFF